jgi:hypothetical protein
MSVSVASEEGRSLVWHEAILSHLQAIPHIPRLEFEDAIRSVAHIVIVKENVGDDVILRRAAAVECYGKLLGEEGNKVLAAKRGGGMSEDSLERELSWEI